jgi:hypothetical protein
LLLCCGGLSRGERGRSIGTEIGRGVHAEGTHLSHWFLDFSLFREIAIAERFKLQLRGESFSIVNTPQWNNPDTNIGNARTAANPNGTFGYITGAGGNRQIQFGAKVIW